MKLILAAVTLLVLTACGTEAGPAGPGDPSPSAGSAPVGEYVVTAAAVGGAPRPFADGSEVRFTFRDGKLGITGGCNHLFGDYSVKGDRLTAGPIGGTEMGCGKELMDQDSWLAKFFSGPVTIGHDPLTLTAGDTLLTLTPRSEVHPDKPLLGTRWTLDGLIEGDSVSSIPAGPAVVLTLDKTAASVTGLCNGFGAGVTTAGDEITWEPGMRTLMACADDARMQLDNDVTAILTGTTSYSIDEDRLTLENGDHGLVFVATA
jgi:heat shock protein HslJ